MILLLHDLLASLLLSSLVVSVLESQEVGVPVKGGSPPGQLLLGTLIQSFAQLLGTILWCLVLK